MIGGQGAEDIPEEYVAALHRAIRRNDVEIVDGLLQLRPSLTRQMHRGLNAVLVAVIEGNLAIAEKLATFDPQSVYQKCAFDDATILHLAAAQGRKDIFTHMLKVIPGQIEERTRFNDTARDLAIENGHADIVSILDDIALVHVSPSDQRFTQRENARISLTRNIPPDRH